MRWHFDFMGASRWFFSISGCILLVGALALAIKQLNFGIDFESGTRINVALVKPTDEEGVRDALDAAGISGEEIQQISDPVFGDTSSRSSRSELPPREVKEPSTCSVSNSDRPERIRQHQRRPDLRPAGGEQRLKALIFSLLVISAMSPAASTRNSPCRS